MSIFVFKPYQIDSVLTTIYLFANKNCYEALEKMKTRSEAVKNG